MQIYKILNKINNKIYIGKDTTNNPAYMGSGVLIKLAITKYGLENFEKTIICETEDKKELSNLEKYWIMFHKSTDRTIGYNISDGGDGGDTLTNHPNIDIIRAKLSKSMKNRILSPEHIENLSKNHFSKIGRSGKTYEEIYGENKAVELREKLKNSRKKYTSERERLGEKYDSEMERRKLNFTGINNPMAKNKYSWYHNSTNGKTLRLIENVDEIPNNYKKGRGPKKMVSPYEEIILSGIEKIRTFSESIDEEELKWHWDNEDRIIEAIHETDWLFQFDNQLPIRFDRKIEIKKGVWHRIIKGNSDISILIKKIS